MNKRKFRNIISLSARLGILLIALSFSLFAQGKNPVILIPGLTGSELRNKTTDEKVWFRATRSKTGDIRLPISTDPTKAHDDLVATDVLREAKIGILPSIDIYGGFIQAMALRGGYHEENWDAPSEEGYHDSLYVFPYDWRLDNVENARLLTRQISSLKLKLKKPGLKFDIVAHSMGGLIARYAAMYGDVDLPIGNRKPSPTWAGARDFDKIVLLGTPNEGSANSLSAMLDGYSFNGIRITLPFVQDTSKFTVFTIPAGYELLPAPGTLLAFDENLQPISIDIYDPKVWTKYGWGALNDKDFTSKFDAAERKLAAPFFAAALDRAKRLYEALSASPGKSGGVSFFTVGADCKSAVDAIVVYRDEKADKWRTIFKPKGFTRSDGVKVTDDDLKKIMIMPGDGVITVRSLEATTQSEKAHTPSIFGSRSGKLICEEHPKLASNAIIQDYIIGLLDGKGMPVTADTVNNGTREK